MESIGKYLKNLREEKNLSLEQISEQTKIKVRILQGIERDNFDSLGGDGYAKAMLLNYAKHVDGNSQKILEKYSETHQTKDISYIIESPNVVQNKMLISGNILYIILLVILVVTLTFVTIHFYKNGMLKSPLKSNKTEQTDKKEIKPKKIVLKNDIKANVTKQIKDLKKNEVKKITINKDALNDTTDYLNKLMFKDKDTPYKLDE